MAASSWMRPSSSHAGPERCRPDRPGTRGPPVNAFAVSLHTPTDRERGGPRGSLEKGRAARARRYGGDPGELASRTLPGAIDRPLDDAASIRTWLGHRRR